MPSAKKSKARSKSNAPIRMSTTCSTPGCTCCDANGTSKFALYRKDTNGQRVFTGMACPSGGDVRTDTVRLNDTWGDLEGPGHKVTENEFMTQMSFYPDSTLPFKPVVPKGLLTPVEAAQYWDNVLRVAPEDESEVRAGDGVQVACMDVMPCCDQPARERFWINVHAVVPKPPTIIGTVVEPLYWLSAPGTAAPLDEKTLLQVPLAHVLAVRQGEHW